MIGFSEWRALFITSYYAMERRAKTRAPNLPFVCARPSVARRSPSSLSRSIRLGCEGANCRAELYQTVFQWKTASRAQVKSLKSSCTLYVPNNHVTVGFEVQKTQFCRKTLGQRWPARMHLGVQPKTDGRAGGGDGTESALWRRRRTNTKHFLAPKRRELVAVGSEIRPKITKYWMRVLRLKLGGCLKRLSDH